MMQVFHGLDGLRRLPAGCVMSIGNFDGVHAGHQRILSIAREFRRQARVAGAGVAAVTFEPHPLTVLRPEMAPPRLSSPATKQQLLEEQGVDFLVILPPTRDVLDLSAERFWEILRDQVRPTHLVEGDQFSFGKDRRGTIGRLREWSSASDVQLHVIEPVEVPLLDLSVVPVSSSLIRWLLAYGRARDAAICLGRAFALEGTVVPGDQRGRTIGVPTANLRCDDDQLVPADGVYAARCSVGRSAYPAALSIGNVPTFDGARRQVEAHLIGFAGDLYGQTLCVEVLDWLRQQRKFAGVDPLKDQIQRDITSTVDRASMQPQRPIAALSVPLA